MAVVEPKRDCPHVYALDYESFARKVNNTDEPCCEEGCGAQGENWVCCFCGGVRCSRYIKGHAAEHYEKNHDHCISISFADCSCWCYKCDEYIEDPISIKFVRRVQAIKFGLPPSAKAAARSDADEEGASGVAVPLGEESLVKDVADAAININDAKPGEGLCLQNCSGCVVTITTPIRVIRLHDCKECTVDVRAPISHFDIQKSIGISVRHGVPSRGSFFVVNDSAAVAVLLDLDPALSFFSSFETTNSMVGINGGRVKAMICPGPRSSTKFNPETKAFETKPI